VSLATVPFAKNRQRHGQKVHSVKLRDRAFCKKSTKARSKSAFSQAARPCLLQKNDKGTVKMCVIVSGVTVPFAKNRQRHGQKRVLVSRVTVPFAKNPQRHGRKVRYRVARDRAFCKKSAKARSKSAFK